MAPEDNAAQGLRENGVGQPQKENCSSRASHLSYFTGEQKSDGAVTAEPTDEELLSQARTIADESLRREYLDQLFSRYHTRVGLWCLRITGDRNAAADLAQEILVKAYQALGLFRGDAKFSTWLYSITRNHCLNDAQRRAARGEKTTESIEDDLPAPDHFESRVEQKEKMEQMRKLLHENLEEVEHHVMVLHYGEEMTLEAITRLLGLNNPSGAKAYIVSARRKLKTALERIEARSAARRV